MTSSHQVRFGRSVQGPGCAAGCAWRRGIRALAAGQAVVPQLKVSELPAPGVGGKHVNRCPPRSVNSSCAPGRFVQTMTRIPSGRSARFSRPVSPTTQAPAAPARRRNRPTPRAGCAMEEDGLAGRRRKGQASRVPHLVPGLCEPERLNTELSADLPDLDQTCVDENQADGRADRRVRARPVFGGGHRAWGSAGPTPGVAALPGAQVYEKYMEGVCGRRRVDRACCAGCINPKFPPSRLADAFDQVVEPLITEIT